MSALCEAFFNKFSADEVAECLVMMNDAFINSSKLDPTNTANAVTLSTELILFINRLEEQSKAFPADQNDGGSYVRTNREHSFSKP